MLPFWYNTTSAGDANDELPCPVIPTNISGSHTQGVEGDFRTKELAARSQRLHRRRDADIQDKSKCRPC